ncbi:hypothetical protein GQ53DRAFT_817865 [Thozetella sp. PMI_491]|nr:hypothetical protein GQ53DRAFT_817865 [Thozetella sp. PMI_491]
MTRPQGLLPVPLDTSSTTSPLTKGRDRTSHHLPPTNSNPDEARLEPEPGSWALELALRNIPLYRSLVERYFQTSQIRVVPKVFADLIVSSFETLETLAGEGALSLDGTRLRHLAKKVCMNTAREVAYGLDSNVDGYFGQLVGNNLRWEAVSIFFSLIASSTMLLSGQDPLLEGVNSLSDLSSRMVQASSHCIALWRDAGSINDISVMSIYQNAIVLSLHHGDTDCRTWRRLADLAGAVFEAGLHQNSHDSQEIPPYFVEMRRRLFASAYSMDKSLCIAVGRPPMIARHFCQATLPLEIDEINFQDASLADLTTPSIQLDASGWSLDGGYCVSTWIRLRYLLGTFREQLLNALRESDKENSVESLQNILRRCSAEWDALPSHTRYPATQSSDCTTRRRVLLASIYLDYMFIEFQARQELCRYQSTEQDSLASIAQKIIATILGVSTSSPNTDSLAKGFSWIILVYGIPSARALVHILGKGLPHRTGNSLPSLRADEIIRILTKFTVRLEWIVPQQDGNFRSIQDARQKLAHALDVALDHFEVPGENGTTATSPGETVYGMDQLAWESQFAEQLTTFMENEDEYPNWQISGNWIAES